jgi:Fe-Mn family superoxide dismutase
MIHKLAPLPYAYDALEPYISKETLTYHHDKHHAGYINNLNALIKDRESYQNMTLLEVVRNSENAIFNNAAQAFNHDFYWHALTPKKTTPSPELLSAIEHQFDSLENFKESFTQAALGLFGSGWTWLVQDYKGNLFLENTHNAQTPVVGENRPLLVCDVWEHAYYLDHQNARAAYLENFWKVVNWEFVSKNFSA